MFTYLEEEGWGLEVGRNFWMGEDGSVHNERGGREEEIKVGENLKQPNRLRKRG